MTGTVMDAGKFNKMGGGEASKGTKVNLFRKDEKTLIMTVPGSKVKIILDVKDSF